MELRNQSLQERIVVDLNDLPSDIHQSLSKDQLSAIQSLLETALIRSKPRPKLVDLRFIVDLFFARYYFVLLVGKDQRAKKRKRQSGRVSQVGNIIAAILLLLGLNLLVSSIVILIVYLLKSAVGINLFPGHLGIPD